MCWTNRLSPDLLHNIWISHVYQKHFHKKCQTHKQLRITAVIRMCMTCDQMSTPNSQDMHCYLISSIFISHAVFMTTELILIHLLPVKFVILVRMVCILNIHAPSSAPGAMILVMSVWNFKLWPETYLDTPNVYWFSSTRPSSFGRRTYLFDFTYVYRSINVHK